MTSSARFVSTTGEETIPVELIITDIAQLITLDNPELDLLGPRRKAGLSDLGIVENAVLAIGAGRIVAYGSKDVVLSELFGSLEIPADVKTVSANNKAIIPGFVDPHTHTVFGKTRQDEYERRVKGETYLEIAAAGGGIHSSVADLRQRDEEELTALAVTRLQEMMAHGTTTVEIKSGYGLTLADETKMLRAAGRAATTVGISLVRTCLAAHEVPKEYRDNRAEYIRLITEEILPEVVDNKLADRCDVFCEPSVFDLAESTTILTKAKELGLALTIHADELEAFGGAVLAAELGANSADHLIKIDDRGCRALAESNTVAVLLPGTVFTLGLEKYAPAREMVELGCALALATDFNPGSCPILSMPLVMSIACTQMRLTPAESLVCTTLNSAWALGKQDVAGSLAPGKNADFLVLDCDDYRVIPYRAGHNPVAAVYVGGQLVKE